MLENEKLSDQELDEVLKILGRYAYLMIKNGAESAQVERQIIAISDFLNVKINCDVTLSSVFINIDDTTKTEILKVNSTAFNLKAVDELTNNTYQFLSGQIDRATYYKNIKGIESEKLVYSKPIQFIGAGMVSMPPFLLYQTPWLTFLFGFLLGPVGYFLNTYIDENVDLPYVSSTFGAFVVTILACGVGLLFPSVPAANLIIFGLLPLFPGIAIVDAIHEIVHNEMVSGMVRLLQALLCAGALGVGSLVAIVCFNSIFY